MKLYEIVNEIDDLINSIEDLDNVPVELVGQLESLAMQKDVKLGNIAGLIKNLDSDAEALKLEEGRLKQKRQSAEKKIEWLKGYVSSVLSPTEKFSNGIHSLSFRKSESLEIIDENSIDDRFKTEEVVIKVDKNEIKKAIKSGVSVDGVELIEKYNLQVK